MCGTTLYAEKNENKWYIDSGCTKHMTGDRGKFLILRRDRSGDVAF